jgi:hypothetical protein
LAESVGVGFWENEDELELGLELEWTADLGSQLAGILQALCLQAPEGESHLLPSR